MTLRPRLVLISALVSLVAALVLLWLVDWVRARDARTMLARVAKAQMTELTRESCESDPRWFLAGPRQGRPTPAQRAMPDADVHLPRPGAEELPFAFFAYNEEFLGSSTAAPRFPNEFRRLMRTSPPARQVAGRYESAAGSGWQVAQLTGWTPGPCAVLLFRSWPSPNPTLMRAAIFMALFGVSFGVALAAAGPTVRRIRRLAAAARDSARHDYSATAPLTGRDEISALSFVFNEAASDIRRRIVDIKDREEALRRQATQATEDVAWPLAAVETRLASIDRATVPDDVRSKLHELVREAYRLSSRLENLGAVVRLRTSAELAPRESIDLNALVRRIIDRHAALAAACGVTLRHSVPTPAIVFTADSVLIERALANVVGNAILHNRPGGTVDVALATAGSGPQFSLRVIDSGPGISDQEFDGLTANRRFRGDEARTRRPGGRGLGLAVTREVADRFDLQLEFRRPPAGGLEVSLGTG